MVAVAAEVWKTAPQKAAQAIDRLMALRLVSGPAIVNWVFDSHGVRQLDDELATGLAWEVFYNAVDKMLARAQVWIFVLTYQIASVLEGCQCRNCMLVDVAHLPMPSRCMQVSQPCMYLENGWKRPHAPAFLRQHSCMRKGTHPHIACKILQRALIHSAAFGAGIKHADVHFCLCRMLRRMWRQRSSTCRQQKRTLERRLTW